MAQILPITTTPVVDEWETNREYHNSLLDHAGTGTARAANVHVQESKNAPLFTVDAARKLTAHIGENPFPQYCLLGEKEKTYNVEKPRKETEEQDDPSDEQENSSASKSEDKRLFINMNAPYSAFLCGSQGSGKSHTLSCMLEGALKESKAGKLKQPMAGLVFHYDKPSSSANHQACEAAYLCSTGIPVRVLVPMSSIPQMEQAYANLPGLPAGAPKPVVCPFLLREEHLNVTSMMTLMKVDADQKTILYMEVGCPLLPSMAQVSNIRLPANDT